MTIHNYVAYFTYNNFNIMLLEDLIYILQKEYNEKGNITVGVYDEELENWNRIDIVDDTISDRVDLVIKRN